MNIKPAQAESFVAHPPSSLRAVLLYGPDEGMIRDRALRLARTVVEDVRDGFRVAELDAAALKQDKARLMDEAAALSMLGGRRVVRVREADDSLAPVFATLLADSAWEALVVVEAGTLSKTSKLRKQFEAGDQAAAIGCWGDEGRDLGQLIDTVVREHKLDITRDAKKWLMDHLGADRSLSRAELTKLALYKGNQDGPITLEDALAVVGDSAAHTTDDAIMAAALGRPADLIRALDQAWLEGVAAVQLVRMAQRHFQRLHLLLGLVATTGNTDQAIKAMRPPLFWKAIPHWKNQLFLWSPSAVEAALSALTKTEMACKSTGHPDQSDIGQTLLKFALHAQKRSN